MTTIQRNQKQPNTTSTQLNASELRRKEGRIDMGKSAACIVAAIAIPYAIMDFATNYYLSCNGTEKNLSASTVEIVCAAAAVVVLLSCVKFGADYWYEGRDKLSDDHSLFPWDKKK